MGRGSMEMHQVRYFLAVARTLNFTRAAEECNVAQPSLTRAIRQLEDELGSELFRRERPHAQLTELGQRMRPPLQQCYESALGARSLASSIKYGEVGSLRIALSATIETALLMPYILGRLGSSAFRLSTVPVSMSLAGSRFSSESAQGPFHHGVRGRGGTISYAACR